MTGAELVAELGRRVEDESFDNFALSHKLQAINNASKTLTTLLHNYYLSDFKVVALNKSLISGTRYKYATFTSIFVAYQITGVTATSPTNGNPSVFTKTSHTLINGDTVELSGFSEMTDVNGLTGIVEGVFGNTFKIKGVLGSPAETTGGTVTKVDDGSGYPIRNGITKVYDRSHKRYAQIVSQRSFMPSPTYDYGTICCLDDDKLELAPTSCTGIDVHYIKEPDEIASNSTECEWNNSLEPILLDLAESEIWYADNRPNRGNLAYQRAVNMIQSLNDRILGKLSE